MINALVVLVLLLMALVMFALFVLLDIRDRMMGVSEPPKWLCPPESECPICEAERAWRDEKARST